VIMSSDCLFCRIVRREIPAKIVREDEHTLAFRDIDPKAPTHILVVPKTHVASLADADDPAALGRLLMVAAQIAKAEGIATSGYRTVINSGADAGQTVHHLHVHVLGGRQMTWPPG
jgi:histidine triad (HIT) family protein